MILLGLFYIFCQLNLNVVDEKFDEPDDIVGLCSLKTNKVYQDNKFILLKYLVYFREIYYNKDIKKTKEEIWLAALNLLAIDIPSKM